ncbi:MAG: hypothetical protein KDE09_06720 [Anaerolineales bacterium]|nr:hypothetical protein [Anaerolineales bacterium]MCB8962507.1 hypothetical protein [Ardenticatenales bacterium]MCB0008734.1 hypothetical protein [Anaerolineales bacterium]MCB0011258.1 hypothetical protein [Anaerolineales bacterium]MCB0017467.1 hypothetical protein [Anaerolineales bacterium]
MVRRHIYLHGLLALLFLLTLACGSIGLPELLGGPTATPPPPTATPEGNVLEYNVAPYEVTLAAGENVPGTQIYFNGESNGAFQLSLDGLPVEKFAVDSLTWAGIIAPGVTGDYRMRLVPALNSRLTVAGLVDVTILDPAPVEVGNSVNLSGPIRFNNIPQTYSIELNQTLPGTTVFYAGKTTDGALLGGTIQTSPYRKEGDALVWTGQLRANVMVRYDLRVVNFTDNRLNLVGTADLAITPAQ